LDWIGLEQVGEGKAHAAMAEVYELIGKHEDAIVHMESYLKVAEDTNLMTKVFFPFLV
jgi:ferritin